jgi:hypothetical protein
MLLLQKPPPIPVSKEHIKQFVTSFIILLQGYFKALALLYNLDQGYSISALQTFWARSFFLTGDCFVYNRMFNSIFGLCPLAANSSPTPTCNSQKCLQTLANVSWEIKLSHNWEPLIYSTETLITSPFIGNHNSPLCWWYYADWTWWAGSCDHLDSLMRHKYARGRGNIPHKTSGACLLNEISKSPAVLHILKYVFLGWKTKCDLWALTVLRKRHPVGWFLKVIKLNYH